MLESSIVDVVDSPALLEDSTGPQKAELFFMTFVPNYFASKRWGKVGQQ
jgi:hypothetical protein